MRVVATMLSPAYSILPSTRITSFRQQLGFNHACAAPKGLQVDQARAARLVCSAAPEQPQSLALNSDEELLQLLRARQPEGATRPGAVHLVGTGPGDPGLLTLRALHLMQTADVVLYDRLVSEDILSMVHAGAIMVYVGKQRGFHTRTQDEIHDLLLHFTREGATVIRLKGGDPYVFGRGGEEAQFLEAQGVRVHVVPGITAASGISAELGVPLTHRGLATSVRFLTGHAREGGELDLDNSVATGVDPFTTLVIYMGLSTLPSLTRQLSAAGLSLDTPAVAVERGTTAQQRSVYAELGALQEQVMKAALESPTLIIIGPVVGLAQGWRQYQETGESLEGPPSDLEDFAAERRVQVPQTAELPPRVRQLLSRSA
ncbi:hypothetical protein N2152v2_010636 [Parachlorella kessleri]